MSAKLQSGKTLVLTAESADDNEISLFVRSLRKLNPEVRTNINITVLQGNISKITVELTLVTPTDWVNGALESALKHTKLNVTTTP